MGEAKDARRRAATLRQQEGEAFRNMSPMAAKYGADAKKFEELASGKLKSAQRAGIFASGRYNLADTGAAKAVLKGFGVTGLAAGATPKGTKGYEGQQKVRAEAAEKLASKAAPSAADKDKAQNEQRMVVREQRQAAEEQLETTKRLEKATAEQIKQTQQLPAKLAAAQQNLDTVRSDADQQKIRIASDTTMSAAQQKSMMGVEDNRIKTAQANVDIIQKGINAAEVSFHEAEKALEAHQKETKKLAEEAAKTIVAAMGDAGENIAEQVGRKSGDILTRTLGKFTGANIEVGKSTRAAYKKKGQTASLTSVLAQLQADNPPAPPADTH